MSNSPLLLTNGFSLPVDWIDGHGLVLFRTAVSPIAPIWPKRCSMWLKACKKSCFIVPDEKSLFWVFFDSARRVHR